MPSDVQNNEVNKTTECYQSCYYVRRSAHQNLWRYCPWHIHPNWGLWAWDASLIDHHQNVDVTITQRIEMFLPSGTDTTLDIMMEGIAQKSGDFCLEFIGIVCLIECTCSGNFLCGGRFLSKRKLLQLNIGQRNRVFAGLFCDARR